MISRTGAGLAAIVTCALLLAPTRCLAQAAPTYCCVYDGGRSCEMLTFAACSTHTNWGLSPNLGEVCLRRPDASFYCGPGSSPQTGTLAPSTTAAEQLISHTFQWIDNGQLVGTITFNANGTAPDTWSPGPNTWRIDANGDLLITNSTYPATVVTRLTFDGAGGLYGRRDATSQVQDGVQTVFRLVR